MIDLLPTRCGFETTRAIPWHRNDQRMQQSEETFAGLSPRKGFFLWPRLRRDQFVRVSTRSGLPKSAFLMARMRLIFLRLRISQGFS